MYIRLSPYMSPSLPAIRINVPTVNENADENHEISPGVDTLKVCGMAWYVTIVCATEACVKSCAIHNKTTNRIS